MKRSIALVVAAAALLANALPALADDRHDRSGGHAARRHAPPPRRQYTNTHRYREGQVWHGHRLAYRGGRWGYYAPHNGAQLFINIPI